MWLNFMHIGLTDPCAVLAEIFISGSKKRTERDAFEIFFMRPSWPNYRLLVKTFSAPVKIKCMELPVKWL